MKFPTLFFILFTSFAASAQESYNVPRNEINFEHGYFNRGLFGLSYSRNFARWENGYWSMTGAVSIGVQLVDADFFYDNFPFLSVWSDE